MQDLSRLFAIRSSDFRTSRRVLSLRRSPWLKRLSVARKASAAPQEFVEFQIGRFWATRWYTAHSDSHWPRCSLAVQALFLAPKWMRWPPNARRVLVWSDRPRRLASVDPTSIRTSQ